MTAEDTDFNLRCLIAGKRCLYVPAAQVRHKLRATIDSGALSDLALLAARNEAFVAAQDLPSVLLPFLPFLWISRMVRQTLLVRPSRLRLLPAVARQMPRRLSSELQGIRARIGEKTRGLESQDHRDVGDPTAGCSKAPDQRSSHCLPADACC